MQAQLTRLQQQIEETDQWATGVFLALQAVLPFLLRDHPQVNKMQALLAGMDRRYEELLAHPECAENKDETAGNYEAPKMLYRQLALLRVWPDLDPKQEA
jgi:hypothetical protein